MPCAQDEWIRADFNGMLESGLLCLSHSDTVLDVGGREIALRAGMRVTAFDDDLDERGRPDRLFATGIVEVSPALAQCRGSRWSLRFDADGIRWESELPDATAS